MRRYPLYERTMYATFREMIEDLGTRYGAATAYSYRKHPHDEQVQTVSYANLAYDVRCISTAMLAKGMGRAHIALVGKLTYPWVCTYLSLLACGAVIVPLDAEWTAEDLAATVERADCTAVFYSEEIKKNKLTPMLQNAALQSLIELDGVEGENTFLSLLAEGNRLYLAGNRSYDTVRVSPDALSMLAFTSGTTGKGKGVMLTQTAILSDVVGALRLIEVGPKSVAVLPPHHTFGCNINLVAHLMSGSEVYLSSGIRYLLRELKEQKPTQMALVPLFLESLQRKIMDAIKEKKMEKDFFRLVKLSNAMRKTGVDARRKLFRGVLNSFGGELNLVVCGGAPLSQSLIDFFDNIGITVVNGYGITECSPVLAVNRNHCRRAGSVGLSLPGETLKISSPDENGEGEICVKGSNVMLGYYKDEAATEEAFDADGYFRTGDAGKIDGDGWLYITGRLKNLIILSNGKNVYPEEIEAEFAGVPGVLDCVVYEGLSRRGSEYNTIVAEIYPNVEYLSDNGIEDAHAYFYRFVQDYNRGAVPYKKVGLLKIRSEEFPKNTLRKIVRFKIDKTID